jgi:hypothetical protein
VEELKKKYKKTHVDWKEICFVMADYFANTPPASCLCCTNHMKNVHMYKDSDEVFGCDGGCNSEDKADAESVIESAIEAVKHERYKQKQEQQKKAAGNKRMTWDGTNTEEVVDFCASWVYDLCHIYSTFTNQVTGELTLCIEPADTMRKSCLYIPIGKTVVRVWNTSGFGHECTIKVE